MLGLYIHIPFCSQVCPYCDFTKMVASENFKKSYIEALCKEMKLKKLDNYTFDTLYIGGGTPSSLSLELLEILFSNLEKYINLKSLQEITFEMNPEDVNEDILKLLKKHFVTRISLGIQSLNSKIQSIIKRFLTKPDLEKIVELFKKYDFNNYSFDLMYGFSNETLEDVEEDVKDLLKYNPTHISTYALILEPHTIFYYKTTHDHVNFEASDDLEALMYYKITDILELNGYHNYELSNFSKEGYMSKHNLIYWNYDYYLTLGASATGLYNDVRYKTTSSISKYINGLLNDNKLVYEKEVLSFDELIEEYIITNLRKADGINMSKFNEKFKNTIYNLLPNTALLLKQGYLEVSGNNIFIPKKYRYVSNAIMAKLL